jgi:transposase
MRPYERVQPESQQESEKEMMRYVEIDVGKTRCRAAVMNEKGTIESEFFFENSNKGIANLLSTLNNKDRVVMESTGNLWLNI